MTAEGSGENDFSDGDDVVPENNESNGQNSQMYEGNDGEVNDDLVNDALKGQDTNTEDDQEGDDREDEEKQDSEEGSRVESDSSGESDTDSMDEDETEERRVKFLGDMNDLEKQFSDLKEQLYKERMMQVENKLEEVQANLAEEYTIPLMELESLCKIRREVSGKIYEYRKINLTNIYNADRQAAEQHFENEKRYLSENMTIELEEKLRKVEEDRHTVEMYSDLWQDDNSYGRKRKKGMEMYIPDKRKKPVTVTGPFIVYMLREMDVLEDWAAIRKAKSELARRKAEGEIVTHYIGLESYTVEKHPKIMAKYEDGKFFYEGQWFQKGDRVVLDNRVDSPVRATISAINTGEVWVSKRDGMKCKLYISQFQKGKYLMQRQ